MSAMKELMAVLRIALMSWDHTHVVVTVATCLTVMALHAMVTYAKYIIVMCHIIFATYNTLYSDKLAKSPIFTVLVDIIIDQLQN